MLVCTFLFNKQQLGLLICVVIIPHVYLFTFGALHLTPFYENAK